LKLSNILKINKRRKNKMPEKKLETRVSSKEQRNCARYNTGKPVDYHDDHMILLPYWNECSSCKNPNNNKCGGYVKLIR